MFKKFPLSVFLLSTILGCTPVNEKPTGNTNSEFDTALDINGDTLPINKQNWQRLTNSTDYPFLTDGDLACTSNAVFFYPNDSFNETSIGTPLNQEAANFLADQHWQTNVPNKVKPGSNLSRAISLGLAICEYNRLIRTKTP